MATYAEYELSTEYAQSRHTTFPRPPHHEVRYLGMLGLGGGRLGGTGHAGPLAALARPPRVGPLACEEPLCLETLEAEEASSLAPSTTAPS
eukprot:CAMPEP_0183351874 /NCGR_PEP_ID=MMETSP0164_2-20130417/26312_1 /TAXON_ID=221442 /ORGANISM="Coccolithus pelagicus ssp braarudi, Strain PLY182g" /LENGTH=90 /DNA_ID=CAMNT_0025524173 /DNA_START=32 /DNA_END=301 /DNA_ORIENTATION=+